MDSQMELNSKITYLREKGVHIPVAAGLEIGDDVNLDRISGEGVTLHSGCRIFGQDTFISKGCVIGREGPATIDNCWLGPDVSIKGGFVQGSVFLEKSSVGYGSHVREGCIFEEQAGIAHSVGVKHTILFPFVTLGSLINFCDCLMAGGTSRKNHSEVGSSYIHFNFTPNQDKATPSLIGDVARGVMLNNNPIFLGGQGGLVGPVSLNYGTVIAAGTIQRKDETQEDRLLFGGALRPGNVRHTPGIYQNVGRIFKHNIRYIANLIALLNWYRHVRSRYVCSRFPEELFQGLDITVNRCINERIKRLNGFLEKVSVASTRLLKDSSGDSVSLTRQRDVISQWADISSVFERIRGNDPCVRERELFLQELGKRSFEMEHYTDFIQSFDHATRRIGTDWLYAIVNDVYEQVMRIVPEL